VHRCSFRLKLLVEEDYAVKDYVAGMDEVKAFKSMRDELLKANVDLAK